VKVSGRSARYLATGSGPPLVLLHGTGTNRREWE
jgi:pimeloyl-ACP methyl ester carboxylesterase